MTMYVETVGCFTQKSPGRAVAARVFYLLRALL
jgi:hypothetical protein